MQRNIKNLSNQTFDLLIIGGGINGAAIANVASLNGLKCALIEKGDFASGTSSKSTKLLHGGLRYLENFEFDLVAESLHERYLHVKSAPHLVKVLPFVIPVYKNDLRPLWKMRLGVWLYDVLSGKHSLGRHENLSAEELLKRVPGLKKENLQGGVLYYDVQMNDARLCLENILMADSRGAVIANYVEMNAFLTEQGRCVGIKATDKLTGQTLEIKALKIVCAAGVWTDEILQNDDPLEEARVRMTKGVHIVYRKKLSDSALFLQASSDGRMFFVIPWGKHSLIGTTDTDYKDNPDHVGVEQKDVDYLRAQAQRFFPDESFDQENIIDSFAGLRPLVRAGGSPSKVSRKHLVHQSASGVIYVTGGKYTTYRVIAEDVLKKIVRRPLADTSEYYPLYGGGEVKDDLDQVSLSFGVSRLDVERLIDVYGTRYQDVLALVSHGDVTKAQMIYALQREMAVISKDIVCRRVGIWDNRSELQSAAENVIRNHQNSM